MSRLGKSWNKRRNLWYGLIGTVVLIVAIVAIVGIDEANIGKKTYTGDFAQAGGVRPGDKVRVAGIDVGEVSDTKLAGDHVEITMKVDSNVVVKDDGVATIKMSTLLGQRYIDISLGRSNKELDGERIKHVEVPYDLQKTIEAGTPILADIDNDELAQSISALNKQMTGLPAITKQTLDALTDMSAVINNRADQINQLIKDTNTVTTTVKERQQQLSVIVGQGSQLAGKITAREAMVSRLLDGIAQLSSQAQAIAADNQDQFAPVMANLKTITAGLEKNRDNLRKLLEVLPITARLTTNLTGNGPYANGYLPWGIFPDNWLCLAKVVDGC